MITNNESALPEEAEELSTNVKVYQASTVVEANKYISQVIELIHRIVSNPEEIREIAKELRRMV